MADSASLPVYAGLSEIWSILPPLPRRGFPEGWSAGPSYQSSISGCSSVMLVPAAGVRQRPGPDHESKAGEKVDVTGEEG
jgi:hypothetical protein